MALTARKRYPNRVSRRKIPGVGAEAQRPRRTPIEAIAVQAVSTSVTRITFDQPVSLKGVPQYRMQPGNVLGTAVAINDLNTEVSITHSVLTLTSVSIPFEDPACRNAAGGYVNPTVLLVEE